MKRCSLLIVTVLTLCLTTAVLTRANASKHDDRSGAARFRSPFSGEVAVPDRPVGPVQLVQVPVAAAVDHILHAVGGTDVGRRVTRGLGSSGECGRVVVASGRPGRPVCPMTMTVPAAVDHVLHSLSGEDVAE